MPRKKKDEVVVEVIEVQEEVPAGASKVTVNTDVDVNDPRTRSDR